MTAAVAAPALGASFDTHLVRDDAFYLVLLQTFTVGEAILKHNEQHREQAATVSRRRKTISRPTARVRKIYN